LTHQNDDYCISPYLDTLERISERTRAEISNAIADFLKSWGVLQSYEDTQDNRDQISELFLASLGVMADLIKYKEPGSAALKKLNRARELCGIPLRRP
jgi:hypothetical protein